MTNADLELRIARLERTLAGSRWRTLAAAGIATAIVGLACKPALPDKIKYGDVELDSSGLRIGDVQVTKQGLAIGESRFTADQITMSSGASDFMVMLGNRPQLTLKRNGFSADLVAQDDSASVTVMSGGSDMQTLSTRNAAKAP